MTDATSPQYRFDEDLSTSFAELRDNAGQAPQASKEEDSAKS